MDELSLTINNKDLMAFCGDLITKLDSQWIGSRENLEESKVFHPHQL